MDSSIFKGTLREVVGQFCATVGCDPKKALARISKKDRACKRSRALERDEAAAFGLEHEACEIWPEGRGQSFIIYVSTYISGGRILRYATAATRETLLTGEDDLGTAQTHAL